MINIASKKLNLEYVIKKGLASTPIGILVLSDDNQIVIAFGSVCRDVTDNHGECQGIDVSTYLNVRCRVCPLLKVIKKLDIESNVIEAIGVIQHTQNRIREGSDYKVFGRIISYENHKYKVITLENISDMVNRERKLLLEGERFTNIGIKASQIMHDMRNPISGIYGCVEMLDAMGDKVSIHDYIGHLRKSTNQLLDQIDELTAYATGRSIPVNKKMFNLFWVLNSIKENFEVGSKIVLICPENLEIFANEIKFERIIVNLVKNSIESMGKDCESAIVKIMCSHDEDNVIIKVIDNGPGIPEKVQKHLFETRISANKENGHGLGLSSVKEIVDLHNGKIECETIIGRGTTFKLFFPNPKKEENNASI